MWSRDKSKPCLRPQGREKVARPPLPVLSVPVHPPPRPTQAVPTWVRAKLPLSLLCGFWQVT